MHKLLARQLRRKASVTGDAELAQALAELVGMAGRGELGAAAERLLVALPLLVTEIENTYTQFDRDLALRLRSLDVSSKELLYVNNQLRTEASSRQRALDSLREAANRLLVGAGLPELRDGEANLESLSSMMAQFAQEREAAQQKLRESEARLVLALNVTESVAWDWDISSNRLVVISTGDEVLGYPRERIEHDPPRIGDLVDPSERMNLRSRLVEHMRGETSEFKFGVWMTIKGRDRRFMLFHGKVVARNSEGRALRMAGIMHDLTANKKAEEALHESRAAAEAATRAKSQFLANMSHEIRTPMNGVLGMTELLLGTPLNSKQRQFAETARRSGEALLALINDILDFSKIEAGKMEIDRVEFVLRDMLEDVAQLLAEGAATKGLEVVCRVLPGVPGVMAGDPNRVRQILINLIGNAIKFTEKGEVITEVSVVDDARTRKRMLCFEVRDTGIGIAREAQGNIFNAFSQADGSTTRHYGGTGLGLAICRQLVTLMGGEITLESQPGVGSMFRFTVPCEKIPAGGRHSSLTPHAMGLSGKRLLIVDDSAASRESVRDIAQDVFGMSCSLAADAIGALKLSRAALARGEAFDAAIVKADMPNIDAFALADIFRRDAGLAGMGLILASSMNRAGELERAKAAGFAGTLCKPVRQSDLLRALLLTQEADSHVVSQKMRAAEPASDVLNARFAGRVLVAEDFPVNQEVIRAVLEACGCEVHMANDGRKAVEAIQQVRFDLVLMDCQMPEMDGYMATRAIRALEEGGTDPLARVPIVALTAHATQADRERCLSAGMDSYISKPFTQAILHRELQRWLPGECAPCANEVSESPPADTLRLDTSALNELRILDPTGAKNLLQSLVGTYLEHTALLLKRLRAAVETGDFAAVERESHRLKSGSLTIGAARVGKLAHALEQQSQSASVANCLSLLGEVEVEFTAAERLLKAEVRPARAAA